MRQFAQSHGEGYANFKSKSRSFLIESCIPPMKIKIEKEVSMTTTADSKSGSARKFRVLGSSPIRHDGLDKVTGRAKFGADVQMAGLLHGEILRSPHAHARIRSIDTGKAALFRA